MLHNWPLLILFPENETEVSLFNRKLYNQFKVNPEVRHMSLQVHKLIDVCTIRRGGTSKYDYSPIIIGIQKPMQ